MNITPTVAAPSYPNMSLQELVNRRERKLKDITSTIQEINLDFKTNPSNVDVDSLVIFFNDLKIINEQIEKKKAAIEEKRDNESCCGVKGLTTATWITIGVEFFAAVLLGAGEVGNFVITKNLESDISALENSCNQTLPTTNVDMITNLGIARIVIVVVAASLLIPLVAAIREIDNDRDRAHLLSQISELKEQGKETRDFLASFQSFKKDVNIQSSNPQQQLRTFSQCGNSYDKLPEKGFRELLASKEHWISLMVMMLPEDHPIKIELREMREELLKKTPVMQNSTKVPIGKSSLSDLESGSTTPKSKFLGEKMAFPFRHSPGLTDSISPRQNPDSEFVKEHQKRWEKLESIIGDLKCFQLDGVAINKEAQIAQDISAFGASLRREPYMESHESKGENELVNVVVTL